MNRAKVISEIILWVVLIGLVVAPLASIQANKYIYKQRVTTYLTEVEGFEEADIESIEGKWGFKLPAYYVVVTFKNEPHIEYTYFAHDNDVFQFNYQVADESRQESVKANDLKDYNPRY